MRPDKITSYGHLANKKLTELDKLVQEHVRRGWQPYGPMKTVTSGGQLMFLQCMVEYNNEVVDDLPSVPEQQQDTRRWLDMNLPQSNPWDRPPGCPPGADPE